MRRFPIVSAAAALHMFVATACNPAPDPAPTVSPTIAPTIATTATPTVAPTIASTVTPTMAPTVTPTVVPTVVTAGGTAEKQFEDFVPGNFNRSAQIDNQWMPLKPGTRYIYEGTTIQDDGSPAVHRVEIHVTDMTKLIGGVQSAVTWDLDYSAGELAEAELAFYAQDNDDNVWRMGEYPEAYESGKFVDALAWIHGLMDARAGIMMKADPQPGTPSYSQGWAPAVNWTDRGQVDQVGQKTCVPAGCYENILVIAETSQAEPDAQQLKYYAPGVGNVRVGWRGTGEITQETLELVKIEELSPEALAEVRAKALALEQRAYQISKDVYAHTPPMVYPGGPAAGSAETPSTPSTPTTPPA